MSYESQVAVQVSVVPGSTKPVLVDVDGTIADAIDAAGFDATGYQVRVDGRTVTDPSTEPVERARSIVLTRQVKGN